MRVCAGLEVSTVGGTVGSTSIDSSVSVVGTPLTRAVALPAVDDVPDHEAPLLDRVGDAIREHGAFAAGAAALGGIGSGVLAARAGRGLLRIAGRTVAIGALAGAAAIATTTLVSSLRGTSAPSAARGVAAADPVVRAPEDLRVMTFNLHGGMGPQDAFGSDDEKLDRLAEAIRREQPDVVLLQEVDRFASRSTYRDTITELARRLDPTGAAFTPRGTLVTGRQEGTGILTFNGVEIADARGIISEDPYGSDALRRTGTGITGGIRGIRKGVFGTKGLQDTGTPDYFPRVTTDAMLVTPAGNHVRVLSGHYNWPTPGTDYQGLQVGGVAGIIGAWDGPTIWGADWNVKSATEAGARERELIGAAGLTDAFLGAGIEPGDPARASFGHVPRGDIDRIYASEQFGVEGARVVPYGDDAPDPSDHHPLVVDLHLDTEGTIG